LEVALNAAGESFLRDPSNFDVRLQDMRKPARDLDVDMFKQAKRVDVCLSKIFQWYADDFGESQHACLAYLLPFLDEARRSVVAHLLGIPAAPDLRELPVEPPKSGDDKRKIVAELSALFPVRHISTPNKTVTEVPSPSADCACSPVASFRGIGGPFLPKINFTFAEYDWGLNGS
jgi:hypothetical protein